MADLVLYGTESCHLCEEAEQLLVQFGLDFEKQDIIEDPQLQQRYGLRIPVLLHAASACELNWPFDEDGLREFLAQVSN